MHIFVFTLFKNYAKINSYQFKTAKEVIVLLSMFLMMLDTEEEKKTLAGIYNDYHDKMFAIAFRILHNEHESEDAVSDAFYTIANNVKNFKKYSNEQIKKYAYTTVEFKCKSILKSRLDYVVIEENTLPSIDENLKNVSEENIYVNAILKLPKIYITTLTLRFIYGFNVREIADVMLSSPNTIKSRLARAKKMLKKILKEENLW